jgi:uncharacterized protein YhjY with autotransporter beta-barrel domain
MRCWSHDRPSACRDFARSSLGTCGLILLALLWQPGPAQAQGSSGSLLTLLDSGVYSYNGLERQAAAANDAAYTNLLPRCGPNRTGASACTGSTALLFDRLRELEDNANELLGRGETAYSLHLDPQGIGFALRWTAPEEFAAQGSMTSRFANSQTSVLANRFAALRFAAQGIRIAQTGLGGSDGWSFAYDGGKALGGGASADDGSSFWSRLSVFANAGYGAGDKNPTTFEDAFNFDNTEVSVGADVRLTNHLVVGLLAGHSEKRLDFNSSESIVEGNVRGNGQSVMAYAQLEGDAAYLNASFGVQHLSLSTRRRITYPSNNAAIPSIDETSNSNTGATTWMASLGSGYTLRYRGFSAEPYLNLQYAHTVIAAFTEHSGSGFDFDTGSQSIQSLEGSLGLKFQYALLGRWGVLVPYVYGEARRQFKDDSRKIASSYAGDAGGHDYDLPTDGADRSYFVVGAGGSVVLKHGLQGFMQYVRVLNYANYTDHVVSGGIRWEL